MPNLKDWDPEEALKSLAHTPEALSREFTSFDMVQHMAETHAPGAMAAIIHIAYHEPNPAVRLKAAQYVVERAAGRVADLPPRQSAEDPFDKFLHEITERD